MSSCHFGCHASLKNISFCPLLLPLVPQLPLEYPHGAPRSRIWAHKLGVWCVHCVIMLKLVLLIGKSSFTPSSQKIKFCFLVKNASFDPFSVQYARGWYLLCPYDRAYGTISTTKGLTIIGQHETVRC